MTEISAADQLGFPILTAMILLPLLVALVVLALKKFGSDNNDATAVSLALVASAVELALTFWAWTSLDSESAAMQLTEYGGRLGLDGVSALFVPATAVLTLLALLYARASVERNLSGYVATLMIFESTVIGAFVSVDVFLFWAFFVAELAPTWFLIVNWGTGKDRREAARGYLAFMGLASGALLVGFLLLVANAGEGTGSGYIGLRSAEVPETTQTLIFFLLCLGFGIKAPLFPLHTWLPKVLEHGPLVGMSVILVGIKLGAYGFLRFVLPLLPEASAEWFWLMALIGAISMVYGALIALAQTNLRRLLAFASMSHMGVITLGIFSLDLQGLQGALLQSITLGITGAGLFFIASFLATRVGAPDLRNMGGLQIAAPVMGLSFLVIGLAGVGMPGTSGFNGEHLIMLGAYKQHWVMAAVVGSGTILAAAYFLWFYQRAFLGEPAAGTSGQVSDLNGRERVIAASLIGVVIWIGVFTTPFLETINASLMSVAERVSVFDPQVTVSDNHTTAPSESQGDQATGTAGN